jgi:predicted chitinase
MVTIDELRRIMPSVSKEKVNEYIPYLQQAMEEFDINTYLREAAFMAQIAHESGEFRFMEEKATGDAYEGRKDLGNIYAGDGRKYKCIGPIKLTGRANYRLYGGILGVDLENNPVLAKKPEVGFRIAGLFWVRNKLNDLADKKEFKKITKKINGGYNGLSDREMYYQRALAVLSKEDNTKVTVYFDGKLLQDANPFQIGGLTYVKARSIADAANWHILNADKYKIVFRDEEDANHTINMIIKDGSGYILARDLPIYVHWDGYKKVVWIENRKR